MKRRTRTAAMTIAGFMLLTACQGSSDTSQIDDADTGGTLPADIPQSISIGMPSGLTSIDPNLAVQEVDVMALALTAGTLLESSGDDDGTKPALAEACDWDSKIVFRCTLRPDARFSDGTALTPADVVASFERALGDEANANGGLVANLESVGAEDETDVVFSLKGPQAAFPLVLTEGPLGIYPASAVGSKTFFNQTPMSAGPYQMTGRTGSKITFERNKSYPAELAPVVDKVTFVKVVDAGTRALQLKTGELDAAYQIPANLASELKAPVKPYATSQFGSLFIYMNHKEGALGDKNVRKAISAAIDREQINQIAFNGLGKPIASFFPTTMEGHDAKADTARDLDKAKQLLVGTDCESGCEIEMMQRAGYPPYDTISTIVAANLKEAGINAKIKTVDQATANTNEGNGNFQMEVGGLYDVVNSPELIMLTYGLTPSGGINSLFSYYDNPQLTALYEKLIGSEGADRKPILDEINTIFAEDMPYVPFGDFTTMWASSVSPRVVAFTSGGSFQVGTKDAAPGQ